MKILPLKLDDFGATSCVGEAVANNYSTLLYANEAARIVKWCDFRLMFTVLGLFCD